MGGDPKWEYLVAIYQRYQEAKRGRKGAILDELCANTGYNRKYAIRKLNGSAPRRQVRRGGKRKPLYGSQVIEILTAVWETAGYPWSVKLKTLLPLWMPWIRKRFKFSAGVLCLCGEVFSRRAAYTQMGKRRLSFTCMPHSRVIHGCFRAVQPAWEHRLTPVLNASAGARPRNPCKFDEILTLTKFWRIG